MRHCREAVYRRAMPRLVGYRERRPHGSYQPDTLIDVSLGYSPLGGLQVSLACAENNLAQIDRRSSDRATVDLGLPAVRNEER